MLLEKIPVRFRLSLAHASWMALLFFLIGFGLFKVLEKSLYSSVDAALISSAQSVRDVQVSAHENVLETFFLERIMRSPTLDHLTGGRLIRPRAQIIDLSGKISSKSDNLSVTLPVTPLAIGRAEVGLSTFETFSFKGRAPLRQVTLPIMDHGRFVGELIQVAASLGPANGVLRGTALLLWFLLPIVLVVSIVLGYILTARALKPVRQTAYAASKMGIEDLSIRLPVPEAKDELRELSLTFNAMLDRLEGAVNRLRRFTADVSHELRTPLAVLGGEAELALRRERSNEEYKDSITTIKREARSMTEIVEDLLLLAKAESQSMPLDLKETSCDGFVKNMIESLLPIYKKRNIRLASRLKGKTLFKCSHTYLSLALKNLLINACKHSFDGSQVTLSVNVGSRVVRFEVKDEGEGIPQENLPYIFDAFYRVDSARNRASGGTGIGLSLASALVKLHQGDIKVCSKVNHGTTFTIEIPQYPACG